MVKNKLGIVGGGLSGLFLGNMLKSSGYDDFVLYEINSRNLGGYASWGGMKISFLPAGQSTANYIGVDKYRSIAKDFIKMYENYFENNDSKNSNFIINNGVTNKYYESKIICSDSINKIISSLYLNISDQVVYGRAVVDRDGNFFKVIIDDELHGLFSKIAVCSGRSKFFRDILISLGQKYVNAACLVGFRGVFDPSKCMDVYNYQADFKIKSKYEFQTYCFNIYGDIFKYKWGDIGLYTGAINLSGKFGNVAVGKKRHRPLEVSLRQTFANRVARYYKTFEEFRKSIIDQDYFHECTHFLKILEEFNVKFNGFYAPAAEQFWGIPSLKISKFESDCIEGLYFVGDASGVSYGVLQNYITAKMVHDEILESI